MKRVLFLAYYYPPSIDAGAKRAEGFARYLPEHGYSPVVLTVEDGNYQTPQTWEASDPDWVIRVREATVLRPGSRRTGDGSPPAERSWAHRLLRRVFREIVYIPDAFARFHAPALKSALRLLSERSADVLFTTSSPYTLLRTGAALAKRSGLPWVADLRDLWVNSHFEYRSSPPRRLIDQRLERRWLSRATRITTVTEGLVSVLRNNGYGGIPIDCVSNGFLDLPQRPAAATGDGPLTILFTGTLYEDERFMVTPFLDAVAKLEDPASIRARFVGAVASHFLPDVRNRGLDQVIEFGGRLNREDAQRAQAQSDLLLVLVPDTPAQLVSLPSKTFEYLNSGRPILAVLPEAGEAGRLLSSLGVTRLFRPSDVDGITRCLEEAARTKRRLGGLPSEVDPESVKRFHYRSLAGNLARSLDAAISDRRGAGRVQ